MSANDPGGWPAHGANDRQVAVARCFERRREHQPRDVCGTADLRFDDRAKLGNQHVHQRVSSAVSPIPGVWPTQPRSRRSHDGGRLPLIAFPDCQRGSRNLFQDGRQLPGHLRQHIIERGDEFAGQRQLAEPCGFAGEFEPDLLRQEQIAELFVAPMELGKPGADVINPAVEPIDPQDGDLALRVGQSMAQQAGRSQLSTRVEQIPVSAMSNAAEPIHLRQPARCFGADMGQRGQHTGRVAGEVRDSCGTYGGDCSGSLRPSGCKFGSP